GDDDVVPGVRQWELVVGVDRVAALIAVDVALGRVDGRGGELSAYVLEGKVLGDELGRVELHTDRRLLLAADGDEADARNLADLLRELGVGVVVDLDEGERVRTDGQNEDRRVGRVYLAIGGWRGQVLGQLSACGIDGRLN